MGIFGFLKRGRKIETETERRERLLVRGRITDGVILDSETSDQGNEVVHYSYTIHGVDFEASEILTEEQVLSGRNYAPGASVVIRFDPSNHGNSVLV
ncbi:MAG: hypothetical protein R2684_01460 [Pyrinomonadaceae bacterium]